tara:strand:- start:1967 stop:2893 length:927 start_codon:yes stop_codon:yes gene_type:complete
VKNIFQKTLSKNICFEGIGLHSGKKVRIKLLPAEEDAGITFKRIDLEKNNLVEAKYYNVSSTKLCTTLENKNGVKISTVEHLLAAIYISGIDNVLIEIDNEEVPIMDGSAKDYLAKFKKLELVEQNKKRKYLKITKKIELETGNKKISIEPNESSLQVEFNLNFQNKIIGKQKNIVDFQNDNLDLVSESRTFCLHEDIQKIKKLGLAKGGSLNNAIVVDENKVINKGGLRNEKEFVNHKILDLAGDFLLSGYRVLGKVICYEGGHEQTNLFIRKIFKNKTSYHFVEKDNFKAANKFDLNELVKLAASA